MDNKEELYLSLVEKSVRTIPLDKEEWEARAGLPPSTTKPDSDGDIANNKNNNSSPPKQSSVDNDRPFCFPTISNLRKACLTTPPPPINPNAPPPPPSTTSPTARNRKSNRKTLIAAMEKWVLQNHAKAQKGKACPCVKVLSNSRLAIEDNDTDPRYLLDTYWRNERAEQGNTSRSDRSTGSMSETPHRSERQEERRRQRERELKRKQPGNIACALLLQRDSSRSLVLRCNNTIIDGEIFSSNAGTSSSKRSDASKSSNASTRSIITAESSPSRTAILRCAASLYFRLWYFRTIRKRDIRQTFGFAMASSVSGSGSKKRVTLRVSFLLLEKPSDSGLNSPSIGGRYPLYVYKRRYDLGREGGSSQEMVKQSSSSSLSSTAPVYSSTVLDELAELLYRQSECLPCPYKHARSLKSMRASAGGMLLPDEPRDQIHNDSEHSFQSLEGSVPMHIEGCKIVPTITGSLVIYCRDAIAVRELLERSGPEESESEDREGLRRLVKSFAEAANSSSISNAWYVKYKTPTFGPVWGNSKMAINGPRGGLLRQSRSKSGRKISQNTYVKRWLFLHPIDSWVGSFRSIIITRSAGVAFSEAVDDFGLSWTGFQREFMGLAKSTLEIQSRCNSLVHGDIHEGNVLYYHPYHNEGDEARQNNGINVSSHGVEGQSLFPEGYRLVLIDWDEANRPKPFRRNADTAEERMRYPDGLLDHPKQYTQQQLMHLFCKLAEKYFDDEIEKVLSSDDKNYDWMRDLLMPPPPPSSRASTTTPFHESSFAKFLSRSAVERRFKKMLRGLQGQSWWSINKWDEVGLSDTVHSKIEYDKPFSDRSLVRRSARW